MRYNKLLDINLYNNNSFASGFKLGLQVGFEVAQNNAFLLDHDGFDIINSQLEYNSTGMSLRTGVILRTVIEDKIDDFIGLINNETFDFGEQIECYGWFKKLRKEVFYRQWIREIINCHFSSDQVKIALLALLGQCNAEEMEPMEISFIALCLQDETNYEVIDYALMALENLNSTNINDRIDCSFNRERNIRRWERLKNSGRR